MENWWTPAEKFQRTAAPLPTAELIRTCCSLSMRAHRSPTTPFLLLESHPSHTVFAFPGNWSVAGGWLLFAGEEEGGELVKTTPFGECEIDADLFPSLRRIGNGDTALVNAAFLRSFRAVLENSTLAAEVDRALAGKKQIVFTGHSSGASISILATIWLLERGRLKFQTSNQIFPFCVTFGSPLVGDSVFGHALQREDWSSLFLHFVMNFDIVPRILLAPLSTFKDKFQAILNILCSDPLCSNLDSIGKSQLVTWFFIAVLKNAQSIASHRACLFMRCTNPLLSALTGFIKLSPYRPFGSYAFCSGNGRLIKANNSDIVLELLFYCLQLGPEKEVTEVAFRSLEEHLVYESELEKYLEMPDVVSLEHLEALPLFSNDGFNNHMNSVQTVPGDLGLSTEAWLCLHAAGEWENQRHKNQARIDANYSKIQEAINFLISYRATCEIRGLGYYDTFKVQKNHEDFQANVKRIELAGLWDEIVEMLRRSELPDDFEGRKEWVKLGTSYRNLVEPLDIANYYRHAKNEDTGPYMVNGRPKRYRFTQRWHEKANPTIARSAPESCFWARVEEFSFETGRNVPYLEMRGRILELEEEAKRWCLGGKLSRDVFFERSTFVEWWKTLPEQHRLGSCVREFIHGRESNGHFVGFQ